MVNVVHAGSVDLLYQESWLYTFVFLIMYIGCGELEAHWNGEWNHASGIMIMCSVYFHLWSFVYTMVHPPVVMM